MYISLTYQQLQPGEEGLVEKQGYQLLYISMTYQQLQPPLLDDERQAEKQGYQLINI
jgi:hypothetical protein